MQDDVGMMAVLERELGVETVETTMNITVRGLKRPSSQGRPHSPNACSATTIAVAAFSFSFPSKSLLFGLATSMVVHDA